VPKKGSKHEDRFDVLSMTRMEVAIDTDRCRKKDRLRADETEDRLCADGHESSRKDRRPIWLYDSRLTMKRSEGSVSIPDRRDRRRSGLAMSAEGLHEDGSAVCRWMDGWSVSIGSIRSERWDRSNEEDVGRPINEEEEAV